MPKPTPETQPRPLPGPMLPGMDDFSPARNKLLAKLSELHAAIDAAQSAAGQICADTLEVGYHDFHQTAFGVYSFLDHARRELESMPGGLR